MEVLGGPLNAVNSRMGMNFNLEKWIADGLAGKVTLVESWMSRNSFHGKGQWVRPVPDDCTPQNVDWKLTRQSVWRQQGKVYDRMELELKDGGQKTVFFDISEFFGKL